MVLVLVTLIVVACTGSYDTKLTKVATEITGFNFQLTAPFTEERPKVRIPEKYTCYGENLSPPMLWDGAPDGTVEYALIAEDIDHKTGIWIHWILYNIPGDVTKLAEGIPTITIGLPDGTTQGTNDHKNIGYEGPCPDSIIVPGKGVGGTNWWPEGYGLYKVEPAHRYRFSVYALDKNLVLEAGATKPELLEAMEGHILAQAERKGKFQLAQKLK